MDSFSPDNEYTTSWVREAFEEGAASRIVYGAPITSCPSPTIIGTWAAKSWRAGWAGADPREQ
jgi:hypothetical protein